jgi:arabinose-5-phosphate isomerase
MRVEQLMHGDDHTPVVSGATRMHDVMYEMSRKGLGMTCVVDDGQRLVGIITDGDLRRQMITKGAAFLDQNAGDVMTRNPVTIRRDTLAAEALHVLEQRKITSIVVVDESNAVEGVVHLHDLWRTELV